MDAHGAGRQEPGRGYCDQWQGLEGLGKPMMSLPGLRAHLLQWHHLSLDLLQGHTQENREAITKCLP